MAFEGDWELGYYGKVVELGGGEVGKGARL